MTTSEKRVVYRTSKQLPLLYVSIMFLLVITGLMSLAIRSPEEDYQREILATKTALIGWTLRANQLATLSSWSDTSSDLSVYKDEQGLLRMTAAVASDACGADTPVIAGVLFINEVAISASVSCYRGKAVADVDPKATETAYREFSSKTNIEGITFVQVDGMSKQVQFPSDGFKRVIDLIK